MRWRAQWRASSFVSFGLKPMEQCNYLLLNFSLMMSMFGTYTDHIPQMNIFYQIRKKLFRYVHFCNQSEEHLGPWLGFHMCFHELFCILNVQTSQEIDSLSESRPSHQCYYKKIDAKCYLTDIYLYLLSKTYCTELL